MTDQCRDLRKDLGHNIHSWGSSGMCVLNRFLAADSNRLHLEMEQHIPEDIALEALLQHAWLPAFNSLIQP